MGVPKPATSGGPRLSVPGLRAGADEGTGARVRPRIGLRALKKISDLAVIWSLHLRILPHIQLRGGGNEEIHMKVTRVDIFFLFLVWVCFLSLPLCF